MVLQEVGSEMLHRLVHYVCMFVHDGIVDFGSLQACAHEGNGSLIIQLVLVSENSRE